MLGDNVKELRKIKGITQGEFARILGVSPSTIAMVEINKREFNNELLTKAADYFGVTTDFLLDRTDDSNTSNPTEKPQVKRIIDSLGRAKDILDEMDYDAIADQVERLVEYATKKKNT